MYEDEPAGPGPRRARRRRLRRPPARPAGARRGRGDRLDPGPRHRRLPPRPLHRRQHRRRPPPATSTTTRIVELAERHVEPPAASGDGAPPTPAAPVDGGTARASSRRTPSSTTSASAARASTAATSAATRSPSSTRSSAARPPRGSSARCARSAASPTRSAPTHEQYTDTRPGRHLRRHPRGQRRGGLRDHRPRARRDPHRAAVTDEELTRAKEHVKGRMVLSSESTAARMSRIARATLFDTAAAHARRDARARSTRSPSRTSTELAAELYDAERALGRRDRPRRGAASATRARRPVSEALGRSRMIAAWPIDQVVVSGAAGRMGETVCERGRGRRGHGAGRPGRPGARTSSSSDVLDERRRGRRLHHPRRRRPPTSRVPRRRRPRRRRHHRLRPRRAARGGRAAAGSGANCFVAPNFAIGAVLMMEVVAADRAAHARVRDRRAPPRPASSTRPRAPRSGPRS